MTIKEQAAYLKGMLSGMKLDKEKDETKLFEAIINSIESLSDSFESLDEDVDGILDQLEVIDEDLGAVEDEVYGECDCDCCDEECYEVVCPSCNEKICVGEDILCNEEMNCPNCGELLEFDLDDCDCDCCCDCDDDCDCGCHEGNSCDCCCDDDK